jgi:hypothetical protein
LLPKSSRKVFFLLLDLRDLRSVFALFLLSPLSQVPAMRLSWQEDVAVLSYGDLKVFGKEERFPFGESKMSRRTLQDLKGESLLRAERVPQQG